MGRWVALLQQAVTTTPARPPPHMAIMSRFLGCGGCVACVVALLIILLVAGIELLGAPDGRRVVHGLESAARGSLVSAPQSQRGAAWFAKEFATTVFATLPLFFSAGQQTGMRRQPFFEAMSDANGRAVAWPFFRGFALSKFADVNATLAVRSSH